ncbi:DUF3575 domain-containing protein [uncultured Dysgonomonas sp.]|nr:DUF3575 domain-containing protein [uncultured Dysgonomonas sp.]
MSRMLVVFTFMALSITPAYAQKLAIKSNLFSDITTTINLGVEGGIADKWSLELSGNYNPWTFSDNMKWKHWIIQPEAKYWFCEKFNGHFLGLHFHGGEYNVGNIDTSLKFLGSDLSIFKDNRYEGWLLGGGLSYGYSWILSNHWNLEANIGVGYAHIKYDEYDCETCGKWKKSGSHNYFGVTKFALSIVYIIK